MKLSVRKAWQPPDQDGEAVHTEVPFAGGDAPQSPQAEQGTKW